jgi:hypothetical protein
MMQGYLQVSYRNGRALAAYYRPLGIKRRKSVKCRQAKPGMVIDFAADGSPLGIEILAPAQLTVAAFNRVLRSLGFPTVKAADLAPLRGPARKSA